MLVAASQDQNLLNHLGTDKTRRPSAKQGMDSMVRAGLLSQHLSDLYATQGGLKGPSECIQQDRNGRWNEVVVSGRNPSSGSLTKVSALFFRVDSKGNPFVGKRSTKNPVNESIIRQVEACAQGNNLPIIYIPDFSGKNG